MPLLAVLQAQTGSTHLPFLLNVFKRERAANGLDSAAARATAVMEAAARFIFSCSVGGGGGGGSGGSGGGGGWTELGSRHQFTLITRWHGLPVSGECSTVRASNVECPPK